jgi:hypothetical protein
VQKRDDHLKSPDFFDAAKYPDIVFKSVRIDSADCNQAKMVGDLTIRGITGQIVLDVDFTEPVQDPLGDGKSIGFTTSAKINREDYGIMWNQPMANNGVMVGRWTKMKKEKIKNLEKQGWKVGTVSDFLHLSHEEEEYIEMKIALAKYFHDLRRKKHLTQVQVAEKIKSSQSRVAKIESAEGSVSLDLIVRSIFALGSTKKELAKVMREKLA